MPLITDRDKCAHLLRRFGFGASEQELDFYASGGIDSAVEKLLTYEKTDEGFEVAIDDMRAGKNQQVNMPSVLAWWAARMLITRRPLQEKMTLFWHDHFATSASKVTVPLMMYQQNELLRENALGKFKTLLVNASKDPAMLLWLDNQENVAGKPNENFAREVMELFTLGIGHYTEKDIQEAARAFTGWSFQRANRNAKQVAGRYPAEFVVRQRLHDRGDKTILGKTGKFDGDAVLELLCEQPRTAEYLTTKIWEWFVYPKPSAVTIARHAGVFRESGLDIRMLLRSIMKSSEFYSEEAERAVVKSPADFCIPTLRQLGIGENMRRNLATRDPEGNVRRAALAPAFLCVQSMRSMGMWILYPPDVAGWDGGTAWISSATMVERFKWADKVMARYPAAALFRDDPTPDGIVKRLMTLWDAPIPVAKVDELKLAAKNALGTKMDAASATAAAIQVSRLIFASPEFQFA